MPFYLLLRPESLKQTKMIKKKRKWAGWLTSLCLLGWMGALTACGTAQPVSGYRLAVAEGRRVEMTRAFDARPDSAVEAVLAAYRGEVRRVMSPVLGRASIDMFSAYPESRLGNLVAEVLRLSGEKLTRQTVDVGLMNVHGLRAALPEGDITFGTVYAILPFENVPCVVTLTGAELRRLFTLIVRRENMNISGARFTADREGCILEATVGGRPLEDERVYRLATIDYLAEGNDGMTVLGRADRKQYFEDVRLRDLFIEYVKALQAQGKAVTSLTDGRITLK